LKPKGHRSFFAQKGAKLGEGKGAKLGEKEGAKLGKPCPKVRLSQDRMPIFFSLT
jgi:hypothetical protein